MAFLLSKSMPVLLLAVSITYALTIILPQQRTNAAIREIIAGDQKLVLEIDVLKRTLEELRRDYRHLHSDYQTKMEQLNQQSCQDGAYEELVLLLQNYQIDALEVNRSDGQSFQFERSSANATRYQQTLKLISDWRSYLEFRQSLPLDLCLSQVVSEKISKRKHSGGVTVDLQIDIFELVPEAENV